MIPVFNIHAQKSALPPPARREIITRLNSDYVLKTDGFQVTFPAKPTRTVSEIHTAFGKTNLVNYQLPTSLAFYGVNFLDFPAVVTDKAELDLRFAAMKAAILKDADNHLMSEKEISFGGSPGVEFVIENKDNTITTRGLIIQQRFFQLIVVTKGKFNKSTERIQNFNRKAVDRFINSFSVTEVPTALKSSVELPNDFGIKVENSVFASSFFGFSLKIPENWNLVEREQTDVLKDLSGQNAGNLAEKSKKALDLSFKNTEFLLMMTKSPMESAVNSSVFLVAAEKVSFPNFLPKAVAESFLKDTVSDNERILKTPNLIKIGGVDFAWVEIENIERKYKQRLYVANRKGIALEIFFIYQTEAELKTLLDSLHSIKFSDDKTASIFN
jgi:hypothetical protein